MTNPHMPMDRFVLGALLTVGALAWSACGSQPAPAPDASTKSSRPSTNTVSFQMLATPAPSGGEPLTAPTGEVMLPATLTERTILKGAAPSVSSSPGVLGSVTDVFGTLASGQCRNATIDVSTVSAGSVLKDNVVTKFNATSQVHFNDIIEKQQSVEAGYLVFTAKMQKEDRAEVLIEDVAEQSIDNYDRDKDPAKLTAFESKPLPSGACGRYVIARVVLTALKYRFYSKNTKEAGITSVIKIGGKDYRSHTKQLNDLLLGIVLRPIGYATGAAPGKSPNPPVEIQLQHQ